MLKKSIKTDRPIKQVSNDLQNRVFDVEMGVKIKRTKRSEKIIGLMIEEAELKDFGVETLPNA